MPDMSGWVNMSQPHCGEQQQMSAIKVLIRYICITEASATEEPGAEKLHAGVCAGGAG
jgi:hypothetical protein